MGGEVILVAIDGSNETSSEYALEWAVQNVTKPEDSLMLLAVLPSFGGPKPNLKQRRQYLVARYFLCCGTSWHHEGSSFDPFDESKRDISCQINYVYGHKMQQLCLANNLMQVHCEVKVILDAHLGSVATKAKELKASWVILDRLLKKEADHCIKQLNCNVVLIDHAIPRILKAVNPLAREKLGESRSQYKPTERDMLDVVPNILDNESATTLGSSDIRSSTFGTLSFSLASPGKEYQCKINPSPINDSHALLSLNSEYFNEDFEHHKTINTSPLDVTFRCSNKISSCNIDELNHKSTTSPFRREADSSNYIFEAKSSKGKHHLERTDKLRNSDRRLTDSTCIWGGLDSTFLSKIPITKRVAMTTSNKRESRPSPSAATANRNSIIRKAMSLPITSPTNPPGLCSICKHKTPIFTKGPRKFTYSEIDKATDGFSNTNFMAEGVYGSTYRGELPDGQVIAVKQYKKLKAVATSEFCLEVETLGCAQHRNLLVLVGYCIDTEWLLIYEFACNGSLDMHLHESNQVMAWRERMKIAVGAARGLRYLHEDCRGGCIVHEDLRPSNILLTHDFEPMVGDFGLARWQLNAQLAEETHQIGTLGYLAPEYIQTGQFTEKADVYAFGVILLELLSGFRRMEFSRKIGLNSLSQWGSTMLQKIKTNEFVDSKLNNDFVEREVERMMHAAYLCISPHPEQRPRMSQVLKILEGDLTINGASIYQSSKIFNNGLVGSIKHTKGHMKLSQNNKTNLHVDSDLCSISNPRRRSSQIEENDITGKTVSVTTTDYESYLRGSLAKFVQNSN